MSAKPISSEDVQVCEQLLDYARGLGCEVTRNVEGGTQRIVYAGIDIGWVDTSIRGKKGCFGYPFRPNPEISIEVKYYHGKNDGCPRTEDGTACERRFADYYGVDTRGLRWYDGRGERNENRKFICITDLEIAKRVLARDIQDIRGGK